MWPAGMSYAGSEYGTPTPTPPYATQPLRTKALIAFAKSFGRRCGIESTADTSNVGPASLVPLP